jgi:short subunit dehydrogenase-like uncharacterized protein
MKKFLLYGATGYTAGLIIRFAATYHLTPILAGRNEDKIKVLAEKNQLSYRIFDIDDPNTIIEQIKDVEVVLHCAGPFMFTAKNMMAACIAAGVHYLDITGEIPVFELAASNDEAATNANMMLMSGVGFDVVPTDCMALYLKQKMPDATHLKLAFGALQGGLSQGTALTMAEGLGQPSAARVNGTIVPVPLGNKAMVVPFSEKKLFCMTIPWGDVSTAYYSTGIPNIETYTATNPKTYKWVKYYKYIGWLLRTEFMKNRLRNKIKSRPAGPSDHRRAKSRSLVWGEVSNGKQTIAATWSGVEGYTFTAHAALLITQKVLAGNWKKGFQTPAKMYGADLAMEIADSTRQDIV